MPIILYSLAISPPVRAVKLTLKALNLKYEEVLLDLFKGEHLQEKFLKINPIHTVPTLDDDGFIIFDSHAIIGYLMNKYGNGNPLYPNDLQKQAIINQRFHFDSGVLFPRIQSVVRGVIRDKEKVPSQIKIDAIKEAYELLEALLGDNDFIAGNELTVADFCCVTSISVLTEVVLVDVSDVTVKPKTLAWIKRCEKKIDGYKEIVTNVNSNFRKFINELRQQ